MATSRGARKKRSTLLVGVAAALGAIALVVGVLLASMANAGQPSQQQRVTVPGVGERLVNLWVEPAAPGSSDAHRLTAQVTDTGGWPAAVGWLSFHASAPGAPGPVEAQGVYSPDGPGRGQVYNAVLELDVAGQWQVTVRFGVGNQTGEASFTVPKEG